MVSTLRSYLGGDYPGSLSSLGEMRTGDLPVYLNSIRLAALIYLKLQLADKAHCLIQDVLYQLPLDKVLFSMEVAIAVTGLVLQLPRDTPLEVGSRMRSTNFRC